MGELVPDPGTGSYPVLQLMLTTPGYECSLKGLSMAPHSTSYLAYSDPRSGPVQQQSVLGGQYGSVFWPLQYRQYRKQTTGVHFMSILRKLPS